MSGKSSEIDGKNWVIECNHVETPNSSSVLNFKPQLVINQENATLSCLHRMDILCMWLYWHFNCVVRKAQPQKTEPEGRMKEMSTALSALLVLEEVSHLISAHVKD